MIGQTISHYRVFSLLGSRDMGVVYEAENLTLGRPVAVKLLPPEVASEPAALERFLLEARAASNGSAMAQWALPQKGMRWCIRSDSATLPIFGGNLWMASRENKSRNSVLN